MTLPNHVVHATTDGAPKITFTPEGGLAVQLTNKTGGASVKGTLVECSSSTANAFGTCGADEPDPIGVVYEAGVADGSECWIVILGRCQVLLEDSTGSALENWVKVSETQAGRADASITAPSGSAVGELDEHFREIGHCLEANAGGTDQLVYIMLHFN